MSLGSILLEGSVLANLFDPMRPQLDQRKVEGGISLLQIIYPIGDILPQVHILGCVSDHIEITAFTSLSAFRSIASPILRASALAFTWLPARPSNKFSLKV
jgi:hypothetical protein